MSNQDEAVTLRCQDGSATELPLSVVNNSTLLKTALDDAAGGEDINLALPCGVPQKWLHAVAAVAEQPYVLQMLQVCYPHPRRVCAQKQNTIQFI